MACWVFWNAAPQVLRLCRALYQHQLRPSTHNLERSLELHLLFMAENDTRGRGLISPKFKPSLFKLRRGGLWHIID